MLLPRAVLSIGGCFLIVNDFCYATANSSMSCRKGKRNSRRKVQVIIIFISQACNYSRHNHNGVCLYVILHKHSLMDSMHINYLFVYCSFVLASYSMLFLSLSTANKTDLKELKMRYSSFYFIGSIVCKPIYHVYTWRKHKINFCKIPN